MFDIPKINKMLRILEKRLLAGKECLAFVSQKWMRKNFDQVIYYRETLYTPDIEKVEAESYFFVLKRSLNVLNKEERDCLLLRLATDMLAEEFLEESRFYDGLYFYDSSQNQEHTEESLAELFWEKLYRKTAFFFSSNLGIDFQIITDIAEMAYEKEAAWGTLVFRKSMTDEELKQQCSMRIYPVKRVDFCKKNEKLIRKLLAGIGEEDGGLLFVQNSENENALYYCCGYMKKGCVSRNFLSVTIGKRGSWVLNIYGNRMFCVKENRITLLQNRVREAEKKLFAKLAGSGIDSQQVSLIMEALAEQDHGTSVVFLDLRDKKTSRWMERLSRKGRACPVEPGRTWGSDEEYQELLKNISAVDGAIVVDIETCYVKYVNVIVDGMAICEGLPDSGARHNSIRCFIANLKKETKGNARAVAVVFSEDGKISVMSSSDNIKW